MRTTAEYKYDTQGAFQRFSWQCPAIPVDFGVVCLWTAFGLAMTALAVSFGVEVGQALAVAG